MDSHSRAYGIWGDQQVGVGHIFDPIRLVTHALLWNGTADSFIDLHPAGFERSIAYAVAGNLQVGSANGAATGGMNQARLWHGSADSIVDLHQFVVAANPAFVSSFARAIAADGSIVGEANDGVNPYAILWIPVPEPGSFVIMLYGLAVTLIGSAVPSYVNLCTTGDVTLAAVPERHVLLPPDFALTALVAMRRLRLRFF